jgi:CBS domain-containing protein
MGPTLGAEEVQVRLSLEYRGRKEENREKEASSQRELQGQFCWWGLGLPEILARDVMIKEVHTITGDRKVAYARLIMLRHNVGALPVVDAENVVKGIITQRDIDLAGADVSDLLVSDLMTRSLIKAKETTPLRWIVERMIKTGVQRIPVLDEKSKLLGLVTQTTVIKAALMYNLLK